jgi:hypothetical protein
MSSPLSSLSPEQKADLFCNISEQRGLFSEEKTRKPISKEKIKTIALFIETKLPSISENREFGDLPRRLIYDAESKRAYIVLKKTENKGVYHKLQIVIQYDLENPRLLAMVSVKNV